MTAPIEFTTPWRKSSFSGTEANCVEVAFAARVVGVRDSKNQGPLLAVSRDSWSRLLDTLPPRR